MDIQPFTTSTKELFEKAQDVLIVTHEHPSPDSIGSSLALALGLLNQGKKVTVACPDPMTVALSRFIGVNKIVSAIAKKNFVISLDYVDGSIEKVSYTIEGDTFNLVIEPRPGFETFSADKVHYSHSGAAADVIVSVDTIHLGGLKALYETQKDLYASKPIINIDRHVNNAHFGQVNIVDAQASSTAEIIAQLLSGLGIAFTQDIATNLLNALYSATGSFGNSATTVAAFEAAATCMKAGGKRFTDGPTEEVPQKEATVSVTEPVHEAPVQSASSREAPPDWLKPKIFKSSAALL